MSGQVLASYKIAETTDDSKLADMFEAVFHAATAEILIFLTTNPDADKFFPDETKMDHDPDRLLYLMALIHHGSEEEVLAIIKDARQNKHSCMFHSGMFSALSVFGGYTSREIAGILKKREGSIRSIKSRALAKLREKNADL